MNPSKSFSAFIEDIFINDKEISQLQFSYRNENIHQYDIGLLDDYHEREKTSSSHNLWIFHTMGLHAKFSERYPSKWKKFTLADYNRPDLSKEDLEELVDYDNAILYNDYFLYSIVNTFKDKEAVIIFLSDHGERVFDNSIEFGRNLSWNKNDIKQQFEIPFWFYFTEAYREKHPEIYKKVLSVKDKRYMTDIISHTLIYLAGISSKYYQSQYDILNPAYNQMRKRIIRNQREYETIN
jgi:heptose-I-phosphate ethanolaminephosphotransferase